MRLLFVSIFSLLVLTGCTTTETSTATGAVAGTALGGIIGYQSGNTAAGAAIGAAAGGVGGYLVGDKVLTHKMFCPVCGRVYDENTKFCPVDGTALKPQEK